MNVATGGEDSTDDCCKGDLAASRRGGWSSTKATVGCSSCAKLAPARASCCCGVGVYLFEAEESWLFVFLAVDCLSVEPSEKAEV